MTLRLLGRAHHWEPVVPQVPEPLPEGSTGANTIYPQIRQGDHVRARHRGKPWREGTITLIWLGIEEAVNVAWDDTDGTTVASYYPGIMGDEMEVRRG